MPRQNKIRRLPKKVQELIAKLRDQGRTIDEILEVLHGLDHDVSRSGLGRWVKQQKKLSEKIRMSREMSTAIAKEFGDKETSEVARVNFELLHSIILKMMIGGEDDENVELDPKEAMFTATALEKLSKASKLDADRELKIRAEVAKDTAEKAAKKAGEAARKNGLSKDAIKAIKAEILGVAG